MKKFIAFFLVVGIIAFLFAFKTSNGNYLLAGSYCSSPIYYHLGSLDGRFNITHDEALMDLAEAASIWDDASQKHLYEYSPTKPGVTVNLVYDARSALSNQVNDLKAEVSTDKDSLSPQVQEYENRSAAFDKNVAALNADISYWNARGGAPDNVYQDLKKRQSDLQTEARALNDMAANLNQSTKSYNLQVKSLNNTIDALNQSLSSKPEEGIYDGATNTIDIYFNNSRPELIHTLAHELGHARGLDHVPDPKGIMYAQSTENITPTTEDVDQLSDICKERSLAEIYWTDYIDFSRSLKARLFPNL